MTFVRNVMLLMALVPILASSFTLNQIQNYNQIPGNFHPLPYPRTFINSDTDGRPFMSASQRIFQVPNHGPLNNENLNKFRPLPQENTHRKNNIPANTLFSPSQQFASNSGGRNGEQTGSRGPTTFSFPSNNFARTPMHESTPVDGSTLNVLNVAQQESIGAETAGEVRSSNEKSHFNRPKLNSVSAKDKPGKSTIVKKPINEGKRFEYGKKMNNQRIESNMKENLSEENGQLEAPISIDNHVKCGSEQSTGACETSSKLKVEEKESSDGSTEQSSGDHLDDKQIPNFDSSLGSVKISDEEDEIKSLASPTQNKAERRKGKSKDKKNDLPESVVHPKSGVKAPETTHKKSQPAPAPKVKLEPKIEPKAEPKELKEHKVQKEHKEHKEHKEPKPHHIELHAHNHFENHQHISLHTKLHHPIDHPKKFSLGHPPLIHLTPEQSLSQYHEHEFEKPEHVKEYQHYEPVDIHMNHRPEVMHAPHLENVVIEDQSELDTYHRAPDVSYHEDVISHPHGHGMSPIGHSSFIHPMFHG